MNRDSGHCLDCNSLRSLYKRMADLFCKRHWNSPVLLHKITQSSPSSVKIRSHPGIVNAFESANDALHEEYPLPPLCGNLGSCPRTSASASCKLRVYPSGRCRHITRRHWKLPYWICGLRLGMYANRQYCENLSQSITWPGHIVLTYATEVLHRNRF